MSNLTWKAKFTPFELVHIITHHLFKLEPLNLDKRCKPSCLWCLSFWGGHWQLPVLHSQPSPNIHPESDRRCSMVLLFHKSITAPWIVLILCTPCCACTCSIAIDLIRSRVWYSLWFTAELFISRLRTWLMHARYANSTNQKVLQTQVHSESLAGQNMGSSHPGSAHWRDALPSPPGTGF